MQKDEFFLILFLTIIVTVLSFSCTKEIPLDFPDSKNRLVLNCIFHPNSPFEIFFTKTQSLADSSQAVNAELQIQLYKNGNLICDTTIQGDTLITDIFPQAGAAYSVMVLSDEFPTLYASDTIPYALEVNRTGIISTQVPDEFGDVCISVEISFSDEAGQKNYYEIVIDESDPWSYSSWDERFTDPVLLNEGDVDFILNSIFFSDALFNGKSYTVSIPQCSIHESNAGRFKITASFRATSHSYYQYKKSFTRHRALQQIQGDFLDLIFMGVPSDMFSNVSGGYGVFACYSANVITISSDKP